MPSAKKIYPVVCKDWLRMHGHTDILTWTIPISATGSSEIETIIALVEYKDANITILMVKKSMNSEKSFSEVPFGQGINITQFHSLGDTFSVKSSLCISACQQYIYIHITQPCD